MKGVPIHPHCYSVLVCWMGNRMANYSAELRSISTETCGRQHPFVSVIYFHSNSGFRYNAEIA